LAKNSFLKIKCSKKMLDLIKLYSYIGLKIIVNTYFLKPKHIQTQGEKDGMVSI